MGFAYGLRSFADLCARLINMNWRGGEKFEQKLVNGNGHGVSGWAAGNLWKGLSAIIWRLWPGLIGYHVITSPTETESGQYRSVVPWPIQWTTCNNVWPVHIFPPFCHPGLYLKTTRDLFVIRTARMQHLAIRALKSLSVRLFKYLWSLILIVSHINGFKKCGSFQNGLYLTANHQISVIIRRDILNSICTLTPAKRARLRGLPLPKQGFLCLNNNGLFQYRRERRYSRWVFSFWTRPISVCIRHSLFKFDNRRNSRQKAFKARWISYKRSLLGLLTHKLLIIALALKIV